MVVVALGMKTSLSGFSEKEDTLREAIALVAGTNISNVMIRSVSQTADERRGGVDVGANADRTAGFTLNPRHHSLRSEPTVYSQSIKASVEIELQIAAASTEKAKAIVKALSADAINELLYSRGIPAVSILSPARLSTDKQDSVLRREVTVVVVVILVSCLSGLVSVAWYVRSRHELDADELEMRKMVVVVRSKLGLTREEGFLMSNEAPTWWDYACGRKLTVIERRNLEALARLGMMHNFEISHVDALVLSVVGLTWQPDRVIYDSASSSGESSGETYHSLDPETPPAERQSRSHGIVYDALCGFLLDTCEVILETQILQHLGELNVTIEQLKEHGINMDVLTSSAMRKSDSMAGAARKADMKASGHVTLGDLVIIQDGTHGAVEMSSGRSVMISQHTLNRLQRRWNIKENEEYLEASDGKFKFLRDKILKLRIWTLDDLRLFHQLKDMAQKKMDVYASISHYQYANLDSDPQGPALKAFDGESAAILRQDHDKVRVEM
jgi:hypothetical protein